MKVSVKLSLSSTFFFLHAIVPFIKIPYDMNLESMALYLFEKNNELEDWLLFADDYIVTVK